MALRRWPEGLPARATPTSRRNLPGCSFTGAMAGNTEAVDWAVQWYVEGGELIQESYVNLIPTRAQGVPM